jgi:site-specific recombinase XerC
MNCDPFEVPIAVAFQLVDSEISTSSHTPQYKRIQLREIQRLRRVVEEQGARTLQDINLEVIDCYLSQCIFRKAKAMLPSRATKRNRHTAVNALFRSLRQSGIEIYSPITDYRAPSANSGIPKAVDDNDFDLLRFAAPAILLPSRNPAVLALATAGASNGEIAVLTIDAVNLSAGTVSLPGASRLDPRVNALDQWGIDALESRFAQPTFRGPRIVTGTISELSGVTSVSGAFSRICAAAGFPKECYEIDSVRRWAAIRIFESSNDLFSVARFLGFRSLDRAADWVNLNWRNNQ